VKKLPGGSPLFTPANSLASFPSDQLSVQHSESNFSLPQSAPLFTPVNSIASNPSTPVIGDSNSAFSPSGHFPTASTPKDGRKIILKTNLPAGNPTRTPANSYANFNDSSIVSPQQSAKRFSLPVGNPIRTPANSYASFQGAHTPVESISNQFEESESLSPQRFPSGNPTRTPANSYINSSLATRSSTASTLSPIPIQAPSFTPANSFANALQLDSSTSMRSNVAGMSSNTGNKLSVDFHSSPPNTPENSVINPERLSTADSDILDTSMLSVESTNQPRDSITKTVFTPQNSAIYSSSDAIINESSSFLDTSNLQTPKTFPGSIPFPDTPANSHISQTSSVSDIFTPRLEIDPLDDFQTIDCFVSLPDLKVEKFTMSDFATLKDLKERVFKDKEHEPKNQTYIFKSDLLTDENVLRDFQTSQDEPLRLMVNLLLEDDDSEP